MKHPQKTGQKSVTVMLSEPIEYGSERIDQLTLRKPKAGDIRKFGQLKMSTNKLLNLAGDLSGHPPSVIDELSIPDTVKVIEAVADFLADGQPTGKKS